MSCAGVRRQHVLVSFPLSAHIIIRSASVWSRPLLRPFKGHGEVYREGSAFLSLFPSSSSSSFSSSPHIFGVLRAIHSFWSRLERCCGYEVLAVLRSTPFYPPIGWILPTRPAEQSGLFWQLPFTKMKRKGANKMKRKNKNMKKSNWFYGAEPSILPLV